MSDHATFVHERVALARADENPTVIARMPSGWAVLGDHQFLLRQGPAWWYPRDAWDDGPRFSDAEHGELRDALRDWLAAA